MNTDTPRTEKLELECVTKYPLVGNNTEWFDRFFLAKERFAELERDLNEAKEETDDAKVREYRTWIELSVLKSAAKEVVESIESIMPNPPYNTIEHEWHYIDQAITKLKGVIHE